MKNLKFLSLLATVAVFIFSCSSDSENNESNNDELAQSQNETENRTIPISELTSGIVINDATIVTGTPPSPTNNLDFQIDTSTQEGFQKNGFNISFSSTDNIAGAYILLQDVDGNVSDDYYEVPFSSFNQSKRRAIKTSKNSKSEKSKQLMDGDFELQVDFDDTISAGKFCYEICLFDENNNISRIEKVCVEVEAWGGNSEIVGEWINVSLQDTIETLNITCDNDSSLEVDSSGPNDKETWTLVLSANGDYYETYLGVEEPLDFNATKASCSAEYTKEDINDKYSGKWAYNEDRETLTIIDFKYEDFIDSNENETYANGEVYFDGNDTTAKIVNNQLVITETYDTGNGTQQTNTLIFNRK